MPAEWAQAPQSIIDLARKIIRDHHPDLEDAGIGFLLRSEASTSQGRTVWAKAGKVDAKLKPYLETVYGEMHFVIWIAADVWAALNEEQRRALIDHELCHLRFENGEPSLVGHDFEEFTCIVERYGLWNHALLGSANAFRHATQLELGLPALEHPATHGRLVSIDPGRTPVEVS
jgi:hypothetical protein